MKFGFVLVVMALLIAPALADTETFSVNATVPDATPVIESVFLNGTAGNISMNCSEAEHINVTWSASDANGVTDLNVANVTIEDGTTNSTCDVVVEDAVNITFQCDVGLQSDDVSGNKTVTVFINDYELAEDTNATLYVDYTACVGGGGAVCGDTVCNGTETCSSCPGDCGGCGGGGGTTVYKDTGLATLSTVGEGGTPIPTEYYVAGILAVGIGAVVFSKKPRRR
jgi:hypothetical protein